MVVWKASEEFYVGEFIYMSFQQRGTDDSAPFFFMNKIRFSLPAL